MARLAMAPFDALKSVGFNWLDVQRGQVVAHASNNRGGPGGDGYYPIRDALRLTGAGEEMVERQALYHEGEEGGV